MNIALFASGRGSNVQAILDQTQPDHVPVQAQCLVCNDPDAPAIDLAKDYSLPCLVLPSKGISRSDWEAEVLAYLSQYEIDYIVLAGFMRLLSPNFIDHFKDRILNIHPSLLPKYPGTKSIEEAYDNQEKETGVTIFYVDAGVDTGRIIDQRRVKLDPDWSLADLEDQIHRVEHEMYTQVLIQLAQEGEDVNDR
ncbi:Phosphoribosylglycinamide formyltransferase [Alloiococcus otitis]|uniref:Phosphoribosylglycinamide formyltransferase n=1 Tax=Alloiococcus otitis ATCC 51267 TaxID=883081 RepID=K9EUS3_9LACT|nr:phosphoribosylglycinamide formyltransferase [Alloiococcus otitis]EKU92910.1 phosphoribosylglycinamide formyltransferase [Alloiococcus otitis ATCC 51267]SUU80421.1 Phosphoribosylglycinamide formyltransferase [Alloiococcus otitis]